MAPSAAERQRKHRRKVRGLMVRIDRELPVEAAAKLRYLAHHWSGTRRAAFARGLLDAWDREGRPMPGHDDDGNPLPAH